MDSGGDGVCRGARSVWGGVFRGGEGRGGSTDIVVVMSVELFTMTMERL